MQVKRLFDIPYHQLENHPLPDSLAFKENGQWRTYSTKDFIDNANKVSQALLALGLKKDDKIAIVSGSRPEWNFADVGMLQIGVINVPLYPTISEGEYKFILNDAEIKYCFVLNKDLHDKVANVKKDVPSLKEIYTFEKVAGAKHFSELLQLADASRQVEVEQIKDSIKEDELATIIYTSGTTGVPKGVMLSHKNIVSNAFASLPIFPKDDNLRAFSFLPMNHVFERMVVYTYILKGASVYYAEGIDKIGDNLKEVCPHVFTAAPRLLEKVYEKIYAKGQEQKGIKKILFFWALELGMKYEYSGKSLWYKIQLAIANALVFSKWRAALGGRVKMIVSGSAALQPRLARVFTAGKIPVYEGYGLTETSPVIACNRIEEGKHKFGTVGIIIEGIEVKIAEDGEILCKGPNIMMGYYKRPDLTAEVIKDGWFHTGDIGVLEDGKFLKITDRKKEMFKTSGGKYCAPQPIENKFKESSLIEQIMVVGDGQKFVAALIVPAFPNLQKWCEEKAIAWTNNAEMVKNPQVLAEYKRIVNEFNPNFGHIEQIKKFELIPEEWTVDNGLLTPTMKLKRKIIAEKYKAVIEGIYG